MEALHQNTQDGEGFHNLSRNYRRMSGVEDISVLAKILSLEQLNRLIELVRQNELKVTEVPKDKVLSMFQPDTSAEVPTPEQRAKRARVDIPDPKVELIVIGNEGFYLTQSELSMANSVFVESSRRVFPEKDPEVFKAILKLMRGELTDMSSEFMEKMKQDILYYGLLGLMSKPSIHKINLRSKSPKIKTSSCGGGDKSCIMESRGSHWENSYGSDESNPCITWKFDSRIVVASLSIEMVKEEHSKPANIFDAVLLAGFKEGETVTGTPYTGANRKCKRVKTWAVIGRASNSEDKKGVVRFSMTEPPVLSSVIRVQFGSNSVNPRDVRLKLRRAVFEGYSVIILK